MKAFLGKYKWPLVLGFDLLLIVGCIFCRWLSSRMLETESVCVWLLIGGQCTTCGGTHFVNSLLHGQILEAFHHNEYLFINTVYLAITLVLLHPFFLANACWAKRILKWMYSIPTMVLFFVGTFTFIILRNLTPIKVLLDLFLGLFSGT